jgi:hypothetical protein
METHLGVSHGYPAYFTLFLLPKSVKYAGYGPAANGTESWTW